MDTLRHKRGMTLIELLVASLLISVVFLAASSLYISTLKLFKSAGQRAGGGPGISTETDAFIAMEHITRRLRLANRVIMGLDSDSANQSTVLVSRQIKIRMDYNPQTLVPNNSPVGTAYVKTDDQWAKYRFVPDGGGDVTKTTLRWKIAAAETGGDVTSADPEVAPGLKLVDSGASLQFQRRDWSDGAGATAGPFTIYITLTANAAGRTFTLWNNIQPHLMANSGDT